MSLHNMVTSSIKVERHNVVDLHPGGTYELDNSYTEDCIIKLSLLSHFVDMMKECWAYSGENHVVLGDKAQALADELFELYKPFIEDGVNIFSYDEFYTKNQLSKYLARPRINGQMNAGPTEGTDGFPEGWWVDFPGVAYKQFIFGKICIDVDDCIRIWQYENSDHSNEHVTGGVEVYCDADYGKIFTTWPGAAIEIATVAKQMWQIDQDYHNPQI